MNKFFFAFVICSVVFVGCRKDSDFFEKSSSNIKLRQGIDNIPAYRDMDEFVFFIDSVQNGDTTVLAYVESDRNFVSMKTLYDEYVADEMLIAEKWENYTLDSIIINNIDTTIIEHSRLFYEYPEVIKVLSHSDGSSHAEMNCFSEIVGGFVNKYGLAIIGDELFQVTWDKIKHTTYDGINSVELLMRSNAMDTTNGVWVYELKNQNSTWQTMWGRSCIANSEGNFLKRRLRVLGYLDFIQWPQGNFKSNQLHHNQYSKIRRLFGTWYDNTKANHTVKANGSSNTFYNYYTGNPNTSYSINTIYGIGNSNKLHNIFKTLPTSGFQPSNSVCCASVKTHHPHVIFNNISLNIQAVKYIGVNEFIAECDCLYP